MVFIYLLLHIVQSRYCEGKDKAYNIGDKAVICVYLNPTNYTDTNDLEVQDMQNVLAFEVKVDEFSGLKLKNSFKDIMSSDCIQSSRLLAANDSSNTTTNDSSSTPANESSSSSNNTYENCTSNQGISVAYSKSIYSKFAPYTKGEYVAKVYSVVITLKSGKVKKVEWDNFCDICDKKCIKWKSEEVCAESFCKSGKESDCDPRIYITWIGTDGNDENLLSASYRISQFRKYSVYSMYSQTKSKF
jgi:hypothetical protein